MKIKNIRETETHIYFWNSVFSNFYHINFNYKGFNFKNSEQAFMWEKAKFFNDDYTADLILLSTVPYQAKKLGRQVKNYNDEMWSDVRYKFMYEINIAKWRKMEDLILSTGDKILVEASPFDKIWGVGLGENDNKILDDNNWKGLNLLGEVLMDVRRKIKRDKNFS